MSRQAEALELIRCAQSNFDNLLQGNPAIAAHPFYKIARMQLDEGVEILSKTKADR